MDTKKRPPKTTLKRDAVKRDAVAIDVPIPPEQWELPAAFSPDHSRFATLKEMVDPTIQTTSSLGELTEDQRAELVAKRIEAQPNFSVSLLGIGTIDKPRAIAEVKARSKIGKALIEIEQRVLNDLFKRAKQR